MRTFLPPHHRPVAGPPRAIRRLLTGRRTELGPGARRGERGAAPGARPGRAELNAAVWPGHSRNTGVSHRRSSSRPGPSLTTLTSPTGAVGRGEFLAIAAGPPTGSPGRPSPHLATRAASRPGSSSATSWGQDQRRDQRRGRVRVGSAQDQRARLGDADLVGFDLGDLTVAALNDHVQCAAPLRRQARPA
jgi:hypothetical protein